MAAPLACSGMGEALPLEADRRGLAVVFMAEGCFLGLDGGGFGFGMQKIENKSEACFVCCFRLRPLFF